MKTKLFAGNVQTGFDEKFNVVFSIGDVRDLGFGMVNRTYTLSLPLTKINKPLIKYLNRADVRTEPTDKWRLYLGEMLVISGTVKVLSISDYTAKIIIESDDWLDTLKDAKLSALDFSASNHVLNHANVEDSWTASYPVYRYPMINFGGLMSGEYGSSARWLPCDFIPMISVASIVSKILEPHTVTSTWLASAYIKDLFILGCEKIADISFIQNKQLTVSAANDTDNQDSTSIPASSSGNSILNYAKVVLSVETADEGADWSNDTYVVPEDGTYKFSVELKLANNAPSQADFAITYEEVTIQIVSVRGVTTTVLGTVSAAAYSATELIENITYSLATDYYHLEAGDEVSVLLYLACTVTNNGAGAHDLIIGVKNTGSEFENVWTETNRYPGVGKTIVISDYLPDMTQVEFLAAIRDIFNNRFYKDRARNVIYTEPWDQFLSATVLDLTAYVDFQSITTEMISQNYNEKINFKWSNDDSDEMFVEYLKLNTDGPGNKELTLSSVFSKAGTEQRQHPFSTILTGPHEVIGEWSIQIPKIWEDVPVWPYSTYKRKVGFNTRLVHWDGLTAGFTWYYETETKNTYPKISGVTWTYVYTNYLMKFYHYIDRGKLFTVKIKILPTFIVQFYTVLSTAANEGFRPTYKITIDGSDNYFFLQRITTDGDIAELELILRQ